MGKVYYINKSFLDDKEEIDLTEDEMKVIEFIKRQGYTTNKLSKDNLGFGKDKNINLFNSIVKNKLQLRQGLGI